MNTTKVPVECWYCESEYDYTKHEICPICERHWLDAKLKGSPPESGTRVSVHVDHVNKRLRTIPALLIVILLLVSGCTHYSCPTYSDTSDSVEYYIAEKSFVAPIEEQRDTVPYKPTNIEKTGAVLFVLFAIYATTNSARE